MGIDRIGKQGPPAPPPEKLGNGRVAESGRPFEVTAPREAAPPTSQAAAVEPLSATLERWLRTGQGDVRGYLDLKVNEATAHLAALPPAELEAIRNALRDRMTSDPMLSELVRMATGQVPEPSGDE